MNIKKYFQVYWQNYEIDSDHAYVPHVKPPFPVGVNQTFAILCLVLLAHVIWIVVKNMLMHEMY